MGSVFADAWHAPVPAAQQATVRLVPIVLREDGKEALGDVYALAPDQVAAGHALTLPPLAAVEDLGMTELVGRPQPLD